MARSQRTRLIFSLALAMGLSGLGSLAALAAEPKSYRLRGFEHLDVEDGRMVHILELEGPGSATCSALLTEPLELPAGSAPPPALRAGATLELSLTLIADDEGKPVYAVDAEPALKILSQGDGDALEPRPRAALSASLEDLNSSRRFWIRSSLGLSALLFLGACACGALLSFGAQRRES